MGVHGARERGRRGEVNVLPLPFSLSSLFPQCLTSLVAPFIGFSVSCRKGRKEEEEKSEIKRMAEVFVGLKAEQLSAAL